MTHNEMPKDTVEEHAQILQDMYFENGAVVDINSWNKTKEILTTVYKKGVEVGEEQARKDAYWHADIVRRRMIVDALEDIKEHYNLEGYIDGAIEALTPLPDDKI
jgi:hypothetical protein